jgi:hypothetical protein
MPTITVTGLDEHTPLKALLDLAGLPNVELGFLYTRTPEGRNRYPERDWLVRALPRAAGNAALHVCGGGAKAELLAGGMDDLLDKVRRIQVNGILQADEVERICARYPTHAIITQHRPGNEGLLAVTAPNHALLVDGSGGQGLAPSGWVRPATPKAVGFAGGLGPDSLVAELPRIRAVATGSWWVDMEGRIRTDDRFDADLAKAAVASFNRTLSLAVDPDPDDPPHTLAQGAAEQGGTQKRPLGLRPSGFSRLAHLAILASLPVPPPHPPEGDGPDRNGPNPPSES